ncbi:hypothetical protein ARMGADRAFT_997778 [Armillaria gallica]|uniref:ABC transmembrane type-1 domain-containing protein n=1 Tax=Armillaria gallica TaxID=47427 RepID=A0A2H3D1N0_ARMGA|nr:hypothetical protein ARMGADRAFT_997778 [Armillaria gallica]
MSSQHIVLQAAGLFVLADLPTVAVRTAVTGTASFLDIFLLAPGMHRQQAVDDINHSGFPTTGAMTTGYVFRVENPATVSYLQTIGRTGHLVTAHVHPNPSCNEQLPYFNRHLQSFFVAGVPATLLYLLCPTLTVTAMVFLGVIRDLWGLGALTLLLLSRLINIAVARRRLQGGEVEGRKAVREPGVEGDLLILLSQDRWVRMQGSVDNLRTVMAYQQLRDESTSEAVAVSVAKLMIPVAAAFAGNISTVGSSMIILLLLSSFALSASSRFLSSCLPIFDCVVRLEGKPKKCRQRMPIMDEMAKLKQSRGNGWTFGMELPIIFTEDPETFDKLK